MKLKKTLICAALFLLASCGPPQPVFKTNFELIVPGSQSGRYCANNCLSTQQMCYQSCAMQKQSCTQLNMISEQNSRLQAQLDYNNYVDDRTRQGKEIKRGYSSFRNYSTNDCDDSLCKDNCNGSFNICYSNCGGKVIPHTNCVANCNQPPQQQ